MIKAGLSNRYKVDPYGTEEILSEVSNSVAPKLIIDYGDEVQEAEFTIRPTKGSLDTNISPIAILNSIKGNTVAWNQLLNKSTFGSTMVDCEVTFTNNDDGSVTVNGTATGGDAFFPLYINAQNSLIPSHKYYVFGCSDRLYIADAYSGCFHYNETFIWSAPSTLPTIYIYLKVPNHDTISNKRVYPQIIDLTLIYGKGNEPTTPEQFEADYYKWFGKQLTYEDYDAGSLRNCKMSGIKTTDVNSNLLGITSIPITTLKGKLNGAGSSVVVFSNGMKKVGTVYDEIVKVGNVIKAIKRIGSVDLGMLAWSNYTEGSSSIPYGYSGATLTEKKYGIKNLLTSCYTSEGGWSYNKNIRGDSGSELIFISDSSLSGKSGSQIASELDGVILYYELETPEEYVVDDISVEKMMLGNTEVKKVYLGNQLIFEESN